MSDAPISEARELPSGDLVSVVMPVYNAGPRLEKSIGSVLAQTHRGLQLILVDDGSADGSAGICDEFAKRDSRVLVCHQENAGPAAARNTALGLAEGDWLMFVDADDWIEPDYTARMLALAREERANLVASDCIMEEPAGSRRFGMIVPDMTYGSRSDLLQDFLSSRIPWSLWGKLFAADLFADVRFRPEDYIAEDLDAFSRIVVENRVRLATTSCSGYHYRVAPGSVDHSFTRRHLCQFDVFERVVERVRDCGVSTPTSPEVFYEERVLNCWRKAIDAGALDDAVIVDALKRACARHRGEVLHDSDAPHALKRRLWATFLGPCVFAKFHNLTR